MMHKLWRGKLVRESQTIAMTKAASQMEVVSEVESRIAKMASQQTFNSFSGRCSDWMWGSDYWVHRFVLGPSVAKQPR
jgi:hypothetical protein